MPTWTTSSDVARAHWSDAASLDVPVLTNLLAAAQEQCEAYAPQLLPDALGVLPPAPYRYHLATVYQARELWQASQRGESDVIGVGDYAIRARPLTAAVKQLLRPQARRMAVG